MAVSLVAATRNAAKVEALRGAAGEVIAISHPSSDISPQVEEPTLEYTGDSVEAIARAKAEAWSRVIPGEWVVATDGGLLVPALGDRWDPARTRRFAGPSASDVERAEALLALASDLSGEDRAIGWREALAIAREGEVVALWSAESPPGRLASEIDPTAIERGNGFWIPVIWECPEFDFRSLVDLTDSEREIRRDHWSILGELLGVWTRSVASS